MCGVVRVKVELFDFVGSVVDCVEVVDDGCV